MSAFTEANRKAFDDLASNYNTKPYQIRISNQVSAALQERKSWLGAQWLTTKPEVEERDVRLLDYACGTGSVTKALGGYVSTIRGIDVSENMVTLYNEAARSSGLESERARAVVGDLLGAEGGGGEGFGGEEWWGFDVVAVGLGFHHFEDPPLAVKRLAERLKAESGVLVIVDFLPFEQRSGNGHGHAHGHGHGHGQQNQNSSSNVPSTAQTIKHHGFTSSGLKKLFEAAGLEDFAFDVLPEPAVFDFPEGRKERTIFIAKGRKSATAWGKLKGWFGGLQEGVGGQMALKADGEGAGGGGFGLRRDGE